MIIKFKIFESDKHILDPYGEEDWEDEIGPENWKKGDIVVCIDDSRSNGKLKIGNEYEISISVKYAVLVCGVNVYLDARRFKLKESKILESKVDKNIECFDVGDIVVGKYGKNNSIGIGEIIETGESKLFVGDYDKHYIVKYPNYEYNCFYLNKSKTLRLATDDEIIKYHKMINDIENRKEKMKEKMKDVDPYSEENWDIDEGIQWWKDGDFTDEEEDFKIDNFKFGDKMKMKNNRNARHHFIEDKFINSNYDNGEWIGGIKDTGKIQGIDCVKIGDYWYKSECVEIYENIHEGIQWWKDGDFIDDETTDNIEVDDIQIGDIVKMKNNKNSFYDPRPARVWSPNFRKSNYDNGSSMGKVINIQIIKDIKCIETNNGWYKMDHVEKINDIKEGIQWWKNGDFVNDDIKVNIGVGDEVKMIDNSKAHYKNDKSGFGESNYINNQSMGKVKEIKIINGVECVRVGMGYYRLDCIEIDDIK